MRWLEEAGMSSSPAVHKALVSLHSAGAVLPLPHASCSVSRGTVGWWSVLLNDRPFSWRSRTEGQSYEVGLLLSLRLCGDGSVMRAGWEEAVLENDRQTP